MDKKHGSDPDDPKTRHCYILKCENKFNNTSYYECVFENCNSKILMRDGIKRYFNADSDRSVEDYQNNFIMIDIETEIQEKACSAGYDDVTPSKLYLDVMNNFKGSNVTLPFDHKEKLVQLIKYYRLKRKRESTAPIYPAAGGVNAPPDDHNASANNGEVDKSMSSPRSMHDAANVSPAVSQQSNDVCISQSEIEIVDISELPSTDDEDEDVVDRLFGRRPLDAVEVKREKLIEIDRDPLDCADLLAADVLPNCDNFSVLNDFPDIDITAALKDLAEDTNIFRELGSDTRRDTDPPLSDEDMELSDWSLNIDDEFLYTSDESLHRGYQSANETPNPRTNDSSSMFRYPVLRPAASTPILTQAAVRSVNSAPTPSVPVVRSVYSAFSPREPAARSANSSPVPIEPAMRSANSTPSLAESIVRSDASMTPDFSRSWGSRSIDDRLNFAHKPAGTSPNLLEKVLRRNAPKKIPLKKRLRTASPRRSRGSSIDAMESRAAAQRADRLLADDGSVMRQVVVQMAGAEPKILGVRNVAHDDAASPSASPPASSAPVNAPADSTESRILSTKQLIDLLSESNDPPKGREESGKSKPNVAEMPNAPTAHQREPCINDPPSGASATNALSSGPSPIAYPPSEPMSAQPSTASGPVNASVQTDPVPCNCEQNRASKRHRRHEEIRRMRLELERLQQAVEHLTHQRSLEGSMSDVSVSSQVGGSSRFSEYLPNSNCTRKQ